MGLQYEEVWFVVSWQTYITNRSSPSGHPYYVLLSEIDILDMKFGAAFLLPASTRLVLFSREPIPQNPYWIRFSEDARAKPYLGSRQHNTLGRRDSCLKHFSLDP